MESIPIKKPWKKPERIFFRLFKKGDPYYYQRTWYDNEGNSCASYEREFAHCTEWHPVFYLGTDEFDCPAYYTVIGWRGYLTKSEAEKDLAKYLKTLELVGFNSFPFAA